MFVPFLLRLGECRTGVPIKSNLIAALCRGSKTRAPKIFAYKHHVYTHA